MKILFNKVVKTFLSNLHWLIAIFLLIYTIIPILSPVFFHLGLHRYGWWIQTVYKFLCHQRPERSIFLFGPKFTYSIEEFSAYGYKERILGYTFVGNKDLGYKIAFCARDTFLYGAMSISGLIICAMKKVVKIKWWVLVLTTFPMLIDGTVQFVSELLFLTQSPLSPDLAEPFYLSNNLTRAVTGMIFGVGMGIFIISELKDAVTKDI